MKRFVLYLIIICFLSSTARLNGQGSLDSASVLLENLYGRLVNNYDDNSRLSINDSIRDIIEWYVGTDTVFNHRFDNLRYLGQIVSQDSTVKIVTWNLVLRNKPGSYFCYFIKKSKEGKENKIFALSTEYNDVPVKTDTTYTNANWYGALYYDLRPCYYNGKQLWVLLGIDYGNPLITKKIIDVLEMADNGTVVFGKRWFAAGDKFIYRAIMEYDANSSISLRFTSEKSILFDHLVPVTSSQINNRQFYGPDYSTDAYIFENGKWLLKINVDARNKE